MAILQGTETGALDIAGDLDAGVWLTIGSRLAAVELLQTPTGGMVDTDTGAATFVALRLVLVKLLLPELELDMLLLAEMYLDGLPVVAEVADRWRPSFLMTSFKSLFESLIRA